MINISSIEETHFWCHACYRKTEEEGVQLYGIQIDMPIHGHLAEMANFRLCTTCWKELRGKMDAIV